MKAENLADHYSKLFKAIEIVPIQLYESSVKNPPINLVEIEGVMESLEDSKSPI